MFIAPSQGKETPGGEIPWGVLYLGRASVRPAQAQTDGEMSQVLDSPTGGNEKSPSGSVAAKRQVRDQNT